MKKQIVGFVGNVHIHLYSKQDARDFNYIHMYENEIKEMERQPHFIEADEEKRTRRF